MPTYPAPILAADRPQGVTAPGDAFTLPPTISGGSSKGNVVAEYIRQVSAGEKFLLTGLGLSGATFPIYSGSKFYPTTTAGDNEKAEVLLPNYGQSWDFGLCWVAASDGVSLPIPLNKTKTTWCQTSWTPGITVNFYGENLAHGNVEGGAAYIAVQPAGGGSITIYPTVAANCHRIPFTVPDLSVGNYYVWAHNGHGGDYGWGKKLSISVVAASNHVKTHNFGTPTPLLLSTTDAAANDASLAASYVENCNLAIAPGLYPISRTIVVPNFSKLASTSNTQKVQFTVLPGTTWPNPEDRGMLGTNSAFLVLLENVELLNPSNVNLNNNASMGREVGLISFSNATQLWLKGVKARWTAPYTEFVTGPVNAADPVQSFRFKTSQHLFLEGCTMTGSGNVFIQCSQVFLTNYTAFGTNNADHLLYGLNTREWSFIGGNVGDLNPASLDGVDRCVRIIKCGGQNGTNQRHHFEGITGLSLGVVYGGTNPCPDANQFEQNLYEGNTASSLNNPTSSTSTVTTVSGDLTNKAVPNAHLATIVRGRGMGQTRGISSSTSTTLTVDEPWAIIPDSTSVLETGVFARDITFYKVNYTGKQANATNPAFTHNSFLNGFGGIAGGLIINQCSGSYMRQGVSIVSTQHEEGFIDQSSFNVVKNSSFPNCRWGMRLESNPPVPTWTAPASGLLCNLFQNNTFAGVILSELVFQLPRNSQYVTVPAIDGLAFNKQVIAQTALNDYTPSFVDDPQYPPVAPLAQALRNFTQALSTALVSQVTIPAGQYPFSYLGTSSFVLSQQSWWTTQIVNKIYAVSTNRLGYISGRPGSNLGVTQLAPAPNAGDPMPGYVLDLKAAITVDGTLFGGLPTTGGASNKLATPALAGPTSITSSGFTISWAAVTGADSYRVRLNNTTLFMPGNVLTYTFAGLPANTLATADVQALDSTNAKQASDYSATVTATTAASTGQPVTLTPTTVDYWRNGMARTNGSYTMRSYNASTYYDTTDSYVDVVLARTGANIGQAFSTSFFQAGTLLQTVLLSANGNSAPIRLNLTGSGNKRVEVRNGHRERAYEQGNIQGQVLQSITAPTALTKVAKVAKQNLTFVIHDSIWSGCGATTPEINGVLELLREQDGSHDYVSNGYGSRQASVAFADSAANNLLVSEIQAAYGARTGLLRVVITLGTNDVGQGFAPAGVSALMAAGWDAIAAAFPSAEIIVISPTVGDSQYINETNLPALRAAIEMQCTNGQHAPVTYISGLNLLNDPTKLADGVHPNDAGHALMATNYLNLAASQVYWTAAPRVQLSNHNKAASKVGGTQSIWDTSTPATAAFGPLAPGQHCYLDLGTTPLTQGGGTNVLGLARVSDVSTTQADEYMKEYAAFYLDKLGRAQPFHSGAQISGYPSATYGNTDTFRVYIDCDMQGVERVSLQKNGVEVVGFTEPIPWPLVPLACFAEISQGAAVGVRMYGPNIIASGF